MSGLTSRALDTSLMEDALTEALPISAFILEVKNSEAFTFGTSSEPVEPLPSRALDTSLLKDALTEALPISAFTLEVKNSEAFIFGTSSETVKPVLPTVVVRALMLLIEVIRYVARAEGVGVWCLCVVVWVAARKNVTLIS